MIGTIENFLAKICNKVKKRDKDISFVSLNKVAREFYKENKGTKWGVWVRINARQLSISPIQLIAYYVAENVDLYGWNPELEQFGAIPLYNIFTQEATKKHIVNKGKESYYCRAKKKFTCVSIKNSDISLALSKANKALADGFDSLVEYYENYDNKVNPSNHEQLS